MGIWWGYNAQCRWLKVVSRIQTLLITYTHTQNKNAEAFVQSCYTVGQFFPLMIFCTPRSFWRLWVWVKLDATKHGNLYETKFRDCSFGSIKDPSHSSHIVAYWLPIISLFEFTLINKLGGSNPDILLHIPLSIPLHSIFSTYFVGSISLLSSGYLT